MNMQFLFIFLAPMLFTANCSYEWDYNYPEVDTLTGWPFYQVQNGDTLGHISERKYGSARFWEVLKLTNANLKGMLEDAVLESPLKILIPPKEECVYYLGESCLVDQEKAVAGHDGGMLDKPPNRRFLANETTALSELQSDIQKATKQSHSFINSLKKMSNTLVNIIIENRSAKTLTNWILLNVDSEPLKYQHNVPFKIGPGHKDHVVLALDGPLALPKSVLIRAQIENENIFVKIYINTQFTNLLQLTSTNAVYSNVRSGYSSAESVNYPFKNSWSNLVEPAAGETNGPFPLSLHYFVSEGAPVVGLFIFEDLSNLFKVLTPSDFWTIKSGTMALKKNSERWQIELIDALTDQYTISQDGYYLGQAFNSVALTLSKVEPPTDNERFKIIKCHKDNSVEYEISQGGNALSYDSVKTDWRFEKKTSACLKSLSINRSI